MNSVAFRGFRGFSWFSVVFLAPHPITPSPHHPMSQRECALGFGEGFCAMGDLVFDARGELGEGLGEAIGDEEGVVSEAAGAASFVEEGTSADAFGEPVLSGGGDECDGAMELGRARGGGGEIGEEFGIVGGIVAMGARIACREDAGFSMEGIDFEAGVIGDGPVTGECGEGLGLEEGIFGEGGARFLDIGEVGKIVCGEDLESWVTEDVLDFADFVFVTRGDEEGHTGEG